MYNRIKVIFYRAYLFYFKNFPINTAKSFLGRVLYRTFGNAIFSINGLKFELNPLSFIDRHILETGTFDGTLHNYIEQELKPGDYFIDIGANIGFYSLIASEIEGVQVYGFEPSPRELKRFKTNISINNKTNIQIFPIALSDINQELILSISDLGNAGMNSIVNPINTFEKVNIQAKRLDSVLNLKEMQKVKIIKIDVEGYEHEVLMGMENLMPFFKGAFIVEISPDMMRKSGRNAMDIYNWMSRFSFSPKQGYQGSGQYDEYFIYTGKI